jgi:protein O-GlcNAc transferase
MEAATIPDAFQAAIQKHRAGRLADAEALYRQILSVQPNHAGALHLLGVIAHQSGRHDLAVEWIRRAIVLHPNDHSAHSNLGEALRALGRLDEAIAAFRGSLQLAPNFPEAHNSRTHLTANPTLGVGSRGRRSRRRR